MRIAVGSQNKVKIAAVEQAIALYPSLFTHPTIEGANIQVPEFGHPKSMQETVEGAIYRAKEAFSNCTYSIGLEGGLIEVPHTHSGFMEVGACAIYDGKTIYLGLSPAYEWPVPVTQLILAGKADASQAFRQLEYTTHDKLGAAPGGIIGLLTHGRMSREDFTKYSLMMAIIQLEQAVFYPTSTSSSSDSKK